METIAIYLKKNYLLLLILSLAVFLRFFGIQKFPPSANWDEISHGYNACSILKTGQDEWGKTFPSIFRAYGDYKLPVYIYITSLVEMLVGPNIFAIRLTSLLAGIGSLIFVYLLTKELFNIKTALIAAFLFAIEPWSFFLSRGAFEANLALFFVIAGVYFFVKATRKDLYFLASFFLFGLSIWTYNSARIFVPLLIVAITCIFRREIFGLIKKNRVIFILSLVIIITLFLPMVYQLVGSDGRARYGKVAIIDEGAVSKINQDIHLSKLPVVLRRVVYNKGTYWIIKFVGNYINHFSGNFLFFKGGSNYQFSVPEFGLIYPVNALFFIIGLISFIGTRDKKRQLIVLWMLLAPIPSSITREAPHVLRSILLLPTPMILTASGLVSSYNWLKRKKLDISFRRIFISFYLVILFVLAWRYLNEYFGNYSRDYSWSWQYGYKQIVNYAKENYDKYDNIIVTKKYGEPHEFFLFFWPWDPDKYRNDPNLIRFYQSKWYWVDRFNKFYFVNDWEIAKSDGNTFVLESGGKVDCTITKCLLITSPENHPKNWAKIKTINFLNNEPAFEIYNNLKED